MKELDSVLSTKDLSKEIKKGTHGTIVHVYDNNNFEVEFFDNNKDTIDVLTCNKSDIIVNK